MKWNITPRLNRTSPAGMSQLHLTDTAGNEGKKLTTEVYTPDNSVYEIQEQEKLHCSVRSQNNGYLIFSGIRGRYELQRGMKGPSGVLKIC